MANTQNKDYTYILTELSNKGIYCFSPRDLMTIFGLTERQAYEAIRVLKRHRLIAMVEKGKNLLLGFAPGKVLGNPFYIATSLVTPSYVSFRSALNFYALTEQVSLTVYVAATQKHSEVKFGNYAYKYVRLEPHKFFGYQRVLYADLPVLIAEPEKAILDSLDHLEYGGGIQEVTKALWRSRTRTFDTSEGTREGLDVTKLIEYTKAMRNRSLSSRLGYLLTLTEQAREEVKELEKHGSASPIRLDPTLPPNSKWDRRFNLNVNVSYEQLFDWRRS